MGERAGDICEHFCRASGSSPEAGTHRITRTTQIQGQFARPRRGVWSSDCGAGNFQNSTSLRTWRGPRHESLHMMRPIHRRLDRSRRDQGMLAFITDRPTRNYRPPTSAILSQHLQHTLNRSTGRIL
jgi:hypothetical protein